MAGFGRRFMALSAKALAFAASLLASLSLLSPAAAIEFEESVTGQTVKDRSRPDVDPRGIRVGSFLLYPAVTGKAEYDSNIFALDKNFSAIIDDFILVVAPEVVLESNWNRHQLNLWARAALGFYTDNSTEDYEDFDFGFDGRIDIRRDTDLTIDGRFQHLHEDRGSPDAGAGINPTEFDQITSNVVFYHAQNRFSIQLRSGITYYDFDDAAAAPPVILINHDDRDRLEWLATGRAGYDISNSTRIFVIGYYDRRNYDHIVDDFGFNRDSRGYSIGGGITVELTGKFSFEGFVGHQKQNWFDTSLIDISGIVWWVEGIWLPTGLTTVSLFTRRTIDETTIPGASGFFKTEGGIVIDHELTRTLIGTAHFTYRVWNYRGFIREDKYLLPGAEITYLMNRNLRFGLSWKLTDRDSNVVGEDYIQHVVSFVIRGAF